MLPSKFKKKLRRIQNQEQRQTSVARRSRQFVRGIDRGPVGSYRFTARTRGRFGSTELKFFDSNNGDGASSLAGWVQASSSLNLIGSGAGASQVVGKSCMLASIYLRALITVERALDTDIVAVSSDVLQSQQTVRVLLVQDTQFNGAAPTISDILAVPDPAAGAQINYLMNLNNSYRFKVIMDEYINLDPHMSFGTAVLVTGPAGGPIVSSEKHFQLNHGDAKNLTKFKRLSVPLEFASQTGANRTLSEVRTNNFSLWLCGSSGSINLKYQCRLRYSDQ